MHENLTQIICTYLGLLAFQNDFTSVAIFCKTLQVSETQLKVNKPKGKFIDWCNLEFKCGWIQVLIRQHQDLALFLLSVLASYTGRRFPQCNKMTGSSSLLTSHMQGTPAEKDAPVSVSQKSWNSQPQLCSHVSYLNQSLCWGGVGSAVGVQ